MSIVLFIVIVLVICVILLATDDGRTDREVIRDLKRLDREIKEKTQQ